MAFGDIPDVPVGTLFDSRRAAYDAGVHRALVAGIVGAEHAGAESIVVSGGYEDDEDYGDVIVYTGHGGNDPNTGRQVADQELARFAFWRSGHALSARRAQVEPRSSTCTTRTSMPSCSIRC